MLEPSIKNLLENEKMHNAIFLAVNPPCVAVGRSGSAVLGLDDQQSDYDLIMFYPESWKYWPREIFVNKKTQKKYSLIYENCNLKDALTEDKDFIKCCFLYLVSMMNIEDCWVNEEYRERFNQYLNMLKKHRETTIGFMYYPFIGRTEKFLDGEPFSYHMLKYAYICLYIYYTDNGLPINRDLIYKIKRMKINSVNDLSDSEIEEMRAMLRHFESKYHFNDEEWHRRKNALIEESEKIPWTSI